MSVVASAARADTDPTNKKLADQKFIEGRDRMKANDFKGACEKFHEAQKFDERNVAILLNLGLCYEKQDKVATALKWYRKTQVVSSELKDPNFKEYEDAAKESTGRLTTDVARITFILNDLQPDAVITIDGTPIERTELTVEVDAGTRVVEAKAAGKQPARAEVAIKNKETKTHDFHKLADAVVGEDPGRKKRRILGLVIGIGVPVVTGIPTLIYAKGQADKFNDPINGGKDKNPTVKKNMRIVGGAWVGVTLISAAVGGYLIFAKPKTETQSAWLPVISPDQVGFAYTGGF